MQRYCGTSARFAGGTNYFINPARGIWRLDREAAAARWQDRQAARKFLDDLGLLPRYVRS
jgi:hypothetical protein